MRKLGLAALAPLALLSASPAGSTTIQTGPTAAGFGVLQVLDDRLAQIADPLLRANAPLCRNLMPGLGMVLHSADQYPAALRSHFPNGEIAVAGTLPQSAAAQAGMRSGDGIAAINGVAAQAWPRNEGQILRDAAFARLSSLPADAPLQLTLRRGDSDLVVEMQPVPACRVLSEVVTDHSLFAHTDGRIIQLSAGFVSQASDDNLAAIFAHELAHVILEHRRRLAEAGIPAGSKGDTGRNRDINRQTEIEADRLSVHLLANAGFDPAAGPGLFRSPIGRRMSGGLLRSPIYPSARDRADTMDREIADYQLQRRQRLSMAGHLMLTRDQPLLTE
ncbi:peptidase M48 family protein [Altererythrobacter xixiisoli]|uniref:Peptidase M48 family protein n=1 Tax=Croceibacterium xixiisoli TaxID=1476466 RepID=A0A6I4U1U9_9SPHN|nr:M48 family metalloprotease [Croceibacterium xixiisoli]MXP00858.1 peptidase M48 family protein [Croceibacterium xixiisoli]